MCNGVLTLFYGNIFSSKPTEWYWLIRDKPDCQMIRCWNDMKFTHSSTVFAKRVCILISPIKNPYIVTCTTKVSFSYKMLKRQFKYVTLGYGDTPWTICFVRVVLRVVWSFYIATCSTFVPSTWCSCNSTRNRIKIKLTAIIMLKVDGAAHGISGGEWPLIVYTCMFHMFLPLPSPSSFPWQFYNHKELWCNNNFFIFIS